MAAVINPVLTQVAIAASAGSTVSTTFPQPTTSNSPAFFIGVASDVSTGGSISSISATDNNGNVYTVLEINIIGTRTCAVLACFNPNTSPNNPIQITATATISSGTPLNIGIIATEFANVDPIEPYLLPPVQTRGITTVTVGFVETNNVGVSFALGGAAGPVFSLIPSPTGTFNNNISSDANAHGIFEWGKFNSNSTLTIRGSSSSNAQVVGFVLQNLGQQHELDALIFPAQPFDVHNIDTYVSPGDSFPTHFIDADIQVDSLPVHNIDAYILIVSPPTDLIHNIDAYIFLSFTDIIHNVDCYIFNPRRAIISAPLEVNTVLGGTLWV